MGHFKQPIGLKNGTSANALYYMEQSNGHDAFFQPFQYVTGILMFNSYWDDRVTGALAFTRVGKQTVSPFAFGAGPDEYAVTGRLTFLPIYKDGGQRLVHLGIGYTYSGLDNNSFAASIARWFVPAPDRKRFPTSSIPVRSTRPIRCNS
ncbi:MAG: hypothetical protein ABSG53_31310 [Thermoguttaceae bacterium]